MPMAIEAIDSLLKQVGDVIRVEAKAAVRAGGEVIEGIVKQNIMERGQRGGNAKYAPVPLFWLRQRETWPDKGSTGRLTSSQAQYARDHWPLKDTGRMMDSVQSVPMGGDVIGVEVAPTVDYAVNHELGTPNIRQRKFMFVTDTDDVNRIVNAVEASFLFRSV